jgi:hypothetical protein
MTTADFREDYSVFRKKISTEVLFSEMSFLLNDALTDVLLTGELHHICVLRLRKSHEISGSHGGEYEDDSFLGYSAV